VSTLGIGSVRGGPIATDDGGFLKDGRGDIVMAPRDDASLAAVADGGGGRFVAVANDASDVDALSGLVHGEGDGKAVEGAASGEWQDRGPWLLLPLLPIVALAFRRGWLLVVALALVPLSPAHADGLADIFRTRDQQAARALAAGDAQRAQALAKGAALRGAAAYRAGDYAAAESALKPQGDSDSQYNLGNALAKQQRYEDAIAAYDRALKTNPHNEDAAANRKAVADFLKKQQENKQKQQDKKGGSGKQDKDQKGQSGDKDQQQGQQDGKDGKQGESGQQSGADGNEHGEQKGAQDKAGEGEGGDRGKDNGKAQAPQGDATAKSEAERAQAQQAQAALKQKMDQALAGKGDGKDGDKDHDLGVVSGDDASSKLPADVQRALMRVPDDPGGLLRRKFMLEYQRRHGAEPEE
jgi:Ca-activated chloride channel family protein